MAFKMMPYLEKCNKEFKDEAGFYRPKAYSEITT